MKRGRYGDITWVIANIFLTRGCITIRDAYEAVRRVGIRASRSGVKVSLHRMAKRGLIKRMQRGVYCLSPDKVEMLRMIKREGEILLGPVIG